MSQKGNQTQQVPAAEPDLAREAAHLMAVFLTVHRLRNDPEVETLKQDKEELRHIERELRTAAGEQLPLAAWLLSFFPDMENQYVETDLDLRQIPEEICDIWKKRDEWKTAAEDYEKQRGIVAESRKHQGEIDKVTKEKRDQETRKRREFKTKSPRYDNIKNYLKLVDEKINKTRGDLADEERKRKALEEKARIQRSAQHSSNVNAEGQPTLETKASEESDAGEHAKNVLPMQQDSDSEKEILARIEKLQGELDSLSKHNTEFENEQERRKRVEVELEDRKQQSVRNADDLSTKDVEQQKKRERCEDRKLRLEKAVSLWLQDCRVHVYCTACQSRKSMRFRHTEASHQTKKFTTKCMECNEKLVVPETLHQGGACSRLTEDVSESAGESLLDRLWIAEAKALEFLRTLSLEHSKPPVSDPRDNVAKIIESLQTTLAKCDEEYKATVESTNKRWRKSAAVEIGKAVSIYSDAWQGEIAKIKDSSSTETTPDQGKSKMREVMERWNSYEEQTLDSAHPMVQLVDLNEDMRDWITGKSKFILDALGKHWDVPRVEHCGLDKLLELATSSETRSRLRLAYRTVDCLDKRINELELSETHEGIVEDFCERLLKKKNISFSPIFTVQTARHENLLEESSRSSLDSPKIRALGYACKKAEQIAFRKLEAELPEELYSISAVARKLDDKLKLDCFNGEAKASLRKLGYDKRFFEFLKDSDSNNENLRELLGLLGFLITYVDDEQIGNEVLSLFRLVQKEEISLGNNPLNGGERNVKKLRPYFQESDFQESDGRPPNICLLHFWKVGDDDQEGILFELPYFPYPKELSDGLVGLLADSSLWVRDFRESGADDALATLQQVVKLENEFREQPPEQHRGVLGNAVCRLLHSLLQWRSQVRQQDVVDDLVQEILKRASKKYVIDLRPDSNQYRDLCNQRVEPDDLEHFEIERVPSEVIDKPRFTLCEFGVGERKAKLKAEVPPVKELGSHLEFFVDEAVWGSLNSLEGLDLPSFRSAKLQHLYKGKNEQLEQIWKRVQKWYGNADSGRKWVGDQIMLMQSEWHPLFKHLIAERKFTLAVDRPDFTDRFRNFFESAFEIVGRGNQDVGAIRDWMIDRFVDPDGVSETPDREVVAVFHLLKGQGPCRLFVQLLNDAGIELKGWSQFKGRKYQDLDQMETEQIERKVFQEGTQFGELFLEDLSLDEEGQIKPLVAVSVGPPVPEWSRLIESLNTTSQKGVSCDEVTSFLRKDLPSAKIRGDAHMRQAVQTLFRKLTDVLVESDLSHEDEDLVYEAVDAYFKQEMSMELFWPTSKRDFGSEWDHWLEIEEDSGGQEFDCRIPGLRDRDSDRPLFRARGNVN